MYTDTMTTTRKTTTTRTFLVTATRQACNVRPVEVTVEGGTLKTAKREALTSTSLTFLGEVRTATLLSAVKS